MNYKINAMYFSPTDATKKTVLEIARRISKDAYNENDVNVIDFTLPDERNKETIFTKEDIVVFGVPVYAGRVPNVLLKYLNTIKGNGALAVPVVTYGNRNYDDALIELRDILEQDGFINIAGAAFVGEHAFSKVLAKDRPDEEDLAIADNFADKIAEKITSNNAFENIDVKGNRPYRKYYMPKNREGIPVDIRKVKPKTNENCTDCKLCAKLCPMGSIDYDDVSKFNGICIKCGACIKKCPSNAKYYDDENYLRHKYELEIEFADRKIPELFL